MARRGATTTVLSARRSTARSRTLGELSRVQHWGRVAAQHPYRTASLLCAVLFLLYLPTLRVPHTYGLLVGSDGIGYFANLRSLVFDHDLQVSDEYRRLTAGSIAGPGTAKYPIGVPLLWLPFYALMHLVVLALRATGQPLVPDGFNRFYQFGACVGTMVYGYLGLLLMICLCRELFDEVAALLAPLLLFVGWNIIYYFLFENSMSHMMSLCLVAALLTWWRCGPRAKVSLYWGGIGLCTGVAAMVRPQDAAFVIAPGIDLVRSLLTAGRARSWAEAAQRLEGVFSLAIGMLIGYMPQLVASWTTYGSPLASGYFIKGETFTWTAPHIREVLFSRWHGLITWHPLIVLVLVGLYILGRLRPAYALQLAAAVAVQVYIVASWHAWWQGDAFGSRMLINCAPVFALGLAALTNWVRHRLGLRPILFVASVAVLWNALFVVQYRLGLIPKATPISWQQLTIGKITMLPHLSQVLHQFIHQHQRFHLH